jgi:PAS domain S-box-containing protein
MDSLRKDGVRSAGWSADSLLALRERAVQKKAEATFDGSHERSNGGAAAPGVAGTPDAAELLEELRIHHIELEMQNEELRLAQTALDASRARYFDLYDLAPVGYVTLDDEGTISEMNLRATSLLAGTRAALNGRHFLRSIASEDQDTYYLSRKRLLKTGAAQFCELRMIRANAPPFWARLEMSIGEEGDGRVCRIVIVDITERKAAEIQVQESERQLRQQADAMPQIVWTATPSGEIDYYNERWYEYTGCTFEQIKDRGWQWVAHADDLTACAPTAARGFATGMAFELKCRLKRASDGVYRWHLARAVPYRDGHGSILRWLGTFTDIHEQELAKERLETVVINRTQALEQLQTQEDELRRLLNEKETLLNEVHHRVKNNLQVIASLLRLQANLLNDSEAATALKESQQRVVSMALIHERLYGSQHMDQIDFGDYIQTLVNDLFYSYTGSANGSVAHVSNRLNAAHVFLKVDQAIPCGLILNELLTNALKYAYPHGESGEIVIDLRENAAGMVTLCVADQGVGLPEGLDWRNSASMGLPIVHLLTEQIGGKLSVQSNPGTAFTIEFRKEGKNVSAGAGGG